MRCIVESTKAIFHANVQKRPPELGSSQLLPWRIRSQRTKVHVKMSGLMLMLLKRLLPIAAATTAENNFVGVDQTMI